MSTYISEPNKHIEEYLDYYFDGRKNFEYAVLLNGAWGSGKTWFIKKYLEKKEDDKRKICYVSLNGISTTSDIDELIFKSIHPILGSKGLKLVGQLGKGLLKATLKVDLDGDKKPDASVSAKLPSLNLPDYLKINDDFILVFDDLERCELKKEEVLGYINYFVEQDGIKTLIISNEEEINKDNSEYIRKKEKLIGATFSYVEDQDLAIQSILDEISEADLKTILNSELELIKQTFDQVGYKNLRSFKQTIFDFERFYKKEYFEWESSFDTEIFKKILKAFLILSLENKKGIFHKEILYFPPDLKAEVSKNSDNKNTEAISGFEDNNGQKFKRKYQLSLKDYIFSKELWDQILNKNIISDELIETNLFMAHFRFKEDKPIWWKLWHYLDLNDIEFKELVSSAKESIEKFELIDITDIMHTISMLVYFYEKKLIDFEIEPLFDKAIDRFKTIVDIDDRYKTISYFDIREESGGYGLYAREYPLFKDFINSITEAYEDKYVEKNKVRVIELLSLMDNDMFEFSQQLAGKYYDYPILSFFKPTDFIEKLLKIEYKNAIIAINRLSSRYITNSQNKIYLQEEEWFNKLIIATTERLNQSTSLIEKHKLRDNFLPELNEIKEQVYKD